MLKQANKDFMDEKELLSEKAKSVEAESAHMKGEFDSLNAKCEVLMAEVASMTSQIEFGNTETDKKEA